MKGSPRLFPGVRSQADGTRTRSVAAAASLRAAALLRGGVPAAKVWRVLGEEPGAPPELVRIASCLTMGQSNERALASGDGQEWRVLAAAWSIAQQSGAPIARTLERIAEALASLERVSDRRAVLLAGPRATIRLVGSLPLVALLFGVVLGFEPFGVLLSPLGALLGVCGGVMLLAGVSWARALTDRLAKAEWVSGIECELSWIALSGGAAQQVAVRNVADRVVEFSAGWVKLSSLSRGGAVRAVLSAATAHGTPAGPMLLAEASAA